MAESIVQPAPLLVVHAFMYHFVFTPSVPSSILLCSHSDLPTLAQTTPYHSWIQLWTDMLHMYCSLFPNMYLQTDLCTHTLPTIPAMPVPHLPHLPTGQTRTTHLAEPGFMIHATAPSPNCLLSHGPLARTFIHAGI